MSPVPDLRLLQVDRELLHLAQKKTGQRGSRVGDSGKIREEIAEHERPCRRRRLHNVETLPPEVRAHLERMPSCQPCQGIGNLRHAGAEIARGVGWRSKLLIAGDEK